MKFNNTSIDSPDSLFRNILMQVNPDYLILPVDQQERYRVSLPKRDNFVIKQMLLKAISGIQANSTDELDSAFKSLNDEQKYAFNKAFLPFVGVGDDCFSLNEYLPENGTILDFKTLYDYDYSDHCFQEQTRKEQNAEYVVRPYRGTLYHSWARLLINGEFHYASLSMAAGYIYSDIESLGYDKLPTLIPFDFIAGKDHGKRETLGTIFNQRVDANGMEGQVAELRTRFLRYIAARHELLAAEFDRQGRKSVYMLDRSERNDPRMDFVFTDKNTLLDVCFRHFMSDCRSLLADSHELEIIMKNERQALEDYLEAACKDILENFNSKVTPFREKTADHCRGRRS